MISCAILGPDVQTATNYILQLKRRGLPLDVLFVELLEPARATSRQAVGRRPLRFPDVTRGVAHLQKLLAVFNDTHKISAVPASRVRSTA